MLNLPFSVVRLAIVLRGPSLGVTVAELGPLWRGAIGRQLREMVCAFAMDTACGRCRLLYACTYAQAYISAPHPFGPMARQTQAPHPLALHAYEIGDEHWHVVEWTLLGPALAWIPALIEATQRVAGRAEGLGPNAVCLQLVDAQVESGLGDAESRQSLPLQGPVVCPPLLRWSVSEVLRRCVLQFQTPLRLLITEAAEGQRGRKRVLGGGEIDFALIWRRLLRRVQLLAQLYGDPGWRLPPGLPGAGERVEVRGVQWSALSHERRSARQHLDIPMEGVMGEITIDLGADAAEVWPWLWLGQWLNVGQSTALGWGRYRLL